MAISSSSLVSRIQLEGFLTPLNHAARQRNSYFPERFKHPAKRNQNHGLRNTTQSRACCLRGATMVSHITQLLSADATIAGEPFYVNGVSESTTAEIPHAILNLRQRLLLADLDPSTAKLVIVFLGPFLSAFAFLFIARIVMSWYPKLPVGKFPYIIAYAPTEPLLVPTRKLIPPLGGVDVTPVVWFGLISFLNEILVGPQGLLVLVSQKV